MLEESNENSDKVQDVPANSTVKQNSDISLLDNYPPSSTDVHSNDPKHPVSDHSKEDEDDEVQIATQMAAVVLAASTKGTVSPSAEANFAKDISATISNLPPTNVLKRKKKRMPVHVNLVQEIISKRIKEQMKAHGNALTTIPCYEEQQEQQEEEQEVVEEKEEGNELSGSTLITSDSDNFKGESDLVQSYPDIDSNMDEEGSDGSDVNNDVVISEDSNDHSESDILEHEEGEGQDEEQIANTCINDDFSSKVENKSDTSLIESTPLNSISPPPHPTIMQQQLATNINYLKNLLLLTSHTCITSPSDDKDCPPSPSSLLITRDASTSNEHIDFTVEEEHDAVQAAETILKVLHTAECSYDHYLSLLPKLNHEKKYYSPNTSLNDEGMYSYDPMISPTSSNMTSPRMIPDLLPSCNPPGGDATNLFFNACSHVIKPAIEKVPIEKSPKAVEAPVSPINPSRPVASSIMSSMFSGLRKNNNNKKAKDKNSDAGAKLSSEANVTPNPQGAQTEIVENTEKVAKLGVDYYVTIEKEMLGLTVENVLERTVVRTVQANGAAKKAGTKVGSLVVKVGSVETENLTHFETIDELRQSQRPLKLVLRRISKDSLKGAREEMARLIRGGGFGKSVDPGLHGHVKSSAASTKSDDNSTLFSSDSAEAEEDEEDSFYKSIQDQWMEGTKRKIYAQSLVVTKRDEALSKVGAKLAWLLMLLVIGLEREAKINEPECDDEGSFISFGSDHSKDYADSAKSVSKILHDYIQKHFEKESKKQAPAQLPMTSPLGKRKKAVSPPPHIQERQRQAVPGASKRVSTQQGSHQSSSTSPSETALLRIGDVLHRVRSFLADYNSPPAALLRGEVIALLCDILELDTDMTLAEEESASSTAGNKTEMMNDLGSAGSLLKLIVLNCTMMKSPGCHNLDTHSSHAGNRFLAVVHRLAASRSTSARVTASSLGPVLWSHLDFPHQLQLRGVITRALHDAEVIVRKNTAVVLHDIAELVFDSRTVPWLVLMCKRAQTDPDPQLRCAAMTLTYHLAEHLPNTFLGDAKGGSRSISAMPSRSDPLFADVHLLQCKLYPVAMMLAEDDNYSVRLAVAAQCDRLAKALGEHWHVVIIDLLQAMLGDKDDRVRGEAVLCVPRLFETIVSDISYVPGQNIFVLDSLLPVALKLKKDPIVDVRISLAAAAGELLSILVGIHVSEETTNVEKGSMKDHKYIDDTLIPLLQELLQDKNAEVTTSALRAVTNASKGHITRERTASKAFEDDSISLSSHTSHIMEKKDPVFRPVLSEDQVLRLIPTLSKLSSSNQWRVRQSAVEIVPALLGCTHKIDTRLEIAQLCKTLMNDSVDAVRYSAAECLCLGGSNIGSGECAEAETWLSKVVLPHMEACRDSKLSKQRVLCLKMIEMVLLDVARPTPSTHTNQSILGLNVSIRQDDDKSDIVQKALEMGASLIEDPIVNVRLNVGRTYGNVVNVLSDDDLDFIISTLEKQIEVESALVGDRDVLYFARRSICLAKDNKALKNEKDTLK